MRPESRRAVQLALPGMSTVDQAVEGLATAGVEQRGAIFTRREVVEFILDLVDYTTNKPLHQLRLLEPSAGDGDFLFPALDRLFTAFRAGGCAGNPVLLLKDAIRAVELHAGTCETTLKRLVEYLEGQGLNAREARALASVWLRQGDFLLTDFDQRFSHVVGNPPYVRQELIPDALMSEYRRRYSTIYDRADLYVPFIEHSLSLLSPGGRLGFICADRWMKNRYGAPLRQLVAERYHFRTFVDMVDTPAFLSEVIAYPAIFVIADDEGSQTRISSRPDINSETLTRLARSLRDGDSHPKVRTVSGIVSGSEPWIVDAPDQLAVVRRLESEFPTIEEAGCRVGIGVASGADKIFVGKLDELDVEPERKLPLAMSRDINSGTVRWRGYGVLNPFGEDGRLVSLTEFPRFARYLEQHGQAIKKRHIAQKNPGSWYRTIDRIYPELTHMRKLLFPDIKGEANVVYEDGNLYPHHNLYFLTSETWDLRALQAVMLSCVARLFVLTYSTKMRGGFLRFQAQYVRRIRLPRWESVPKPLRFDLAAAAINQDRAACDEAAATLYRLTEAERVALGIESRGNAT